VPQVQATGGQDHKIKICHLPPGHPENAQVLFIDQAAWNGGHSPHNYHNLDYVMTPSRSCPPKPTATPKPSPTPKHTPTPTPTLPPGVTPSPTPTGEPPTGGDEVTDGGGTGGGPVGAPVCDSPKPPTPTLVSVVRQGTTAKLTWTAVTPVSHYAIFYGLKPNEYIYGVPNTGNVTTYTIGGLTVGTQYYFSIRAVNNCMPSDPSGSGGQVLGASTLAFTGNSSLIYLLVSAGSFFFLLSLATLRFSKRDA